MLIPKKFSLAGKTYRVGISERRLGKRRLIGEADLVKCRIYLAVKDGSRKQSRSNIEQTYLHEVWHAIWDTLGNSKLGRDERLADSFTNLLHQAIVTSKGKLI